jgi:DnaJ domain
MHDGHQVLHHFLLPSMIPRFEKESSMGPVASFLSSFPFLWFWHHPIEESAMPTQPFDPYAVLNVSRRATTAQIKAAYHLLAKQLHPDTALPELYADDRRSETEKQFQRLRDAYTILGTSEKKAAYDASVSEPVPIPLPSPPSSPPVRPSVPESDVTLLQIPCSVFLQGGSIELEVEGHTRPLAIDVAAGTDVGQEIRTAIGTVIVFPLNTAHEWIVERDFYLRIPVTAEQIRLGAVVHAKTGHPVPPVRLVPGNPLKEWVFPGKGLPAHGDLPAGDLHLLLAAAPGETGSPIA